MKGGIASDSAKSARDLAQKIARQMAGEPLEMLKKAKEQTTGVESKPENPGDQKPQSQEAPQITEQKKVQDKAKSERLTEALKRELEDIRKQDVFKDLQKRISEGEEIPLEEYPSLSKEQKEMLAAQMKAIKEQIAAQRAQAQESAPAIVSKPSRKMGSSQKQEAEKQQQRVEKPVPPSG